MKILWVDDDFGWMHGHVQLLRDEGYEVVTAETVRAAINYATETKFDLAILDVMLPIESDSGDGEFGGNVDAEFVEQSRNGTATGIALGRWLKQNCPGTKIFGLSVRLDSEASDWFERYATAYKSKLALRDRDTFLKFVQKILNNDVLLPKSFIVHGHDEAAKFALKNFLQNRLGFPEPTILHEQPSLGRTLIEKFEDEALDVDLVFVLLTPDDSHFTGNTSYSNEVKRRARQNVIFEMGYFLGLLGRNVAKRKSRRVFLLYKGQLELPTDISGLIYISIEAGIESAGEEIRLELETWLG